MTMRLWTLPIVAMVGLACNARAAATEAPHQLSRELADYLKRPEPQMRLLDGVLLICREAHPDLDLDAERKSFAELAAELKAALAGTASVRQQADVLSQFLFAKHQFGLPQKDDSEAFLLTDVLRNKRGNCLGLSLLCLVLAEESAGNGASGMKLFGVPVPSRSSETGHMFVRFDDGTTRRNFDPVEKGAEHSDTYYQTEFKLGPEDLRSGYASRKRQAPRRVRAAAGQFSAAPWSSEEQRLGDRCAAARSGAGVARGIRRGAFESRRRAVESRRRRRR